MNKKTIATRAARSWRSALSCQVKSKDLVKVAALVAVFYASSTLAQSGLEGRITQTIDALIRVVNVLIAGFIVWSGFLIGKGDSSGFQRLIYGIVGLIVANASYLIINYFSWF